jgi:hypothetical protein
MGPYATNPTLAAIVELVEGLEGVDADAAQRVEGRERGDAATSALVAILSWPVCTNCHTQSQWLLRSCSALRDAHRAAQRLNWIQCGTAGWVVPLGVPMTLAASDLSSPELASGAKAMLQLPDLQCAVLLLVEDEVAHRILPPPSALSSLKGAPGLATISGTGLAQFGSLAHCSAAANGRPVDAGIIIISPAQVVSLPLTLPCNSYPVAIE